MSQRTILVIDGHPSEHSFGHALADAYARGASQHATVERLALRDLSFDLNLRSGHSREQPLEPSLVSARAMIERASHVAWLFPYWWGGPPALVKGFVDRVFLPGWAFKYRADHGLPDRLLTGRSARLLVTMDSPWWWYALAYKRSIHGSFANATLAFVGFSPVKTRVIYKVRELTEAQRTKVIASVSDDAASDARRAPLALAAGSASAPVLPERSA